MKALHRERALSYSHRSVLALPSVADPFSFDVVAARVEDNHFPQIRKFVEISLRFGNFLSAGLLPNGIREFGEQDIGGLSFKPVGK